MTGNQGELGHEFTLVNVLVGTTDTTQGDLEENLIVGDLGDGNPLDLKLFGLLKRRQAWSVCV